MLIRHGFAPDETPRVAEIYWAAFARKLGVALGPERKGRAFLCKAINPQFALVATEGDRILGVAGFKTPKGGLVGGDWSDMRSIYGHFGASWRLPVLLLLERDSEAGTLIMDGIAVAPDARGRGVGTRLLDAVKDRARQSGLKRVRLEVVDTNPRARALYERQGFVAGKVAHLGLLRPLFGFRSATTMIWTDKG